MNAHHGFHAPCLNAIIRIINTGTDQKNENTMFHQNKMSTAMFPEQHHQRQMISGHGIIKNENNEWTREQTIPPHHQM
jgi:hypothetical protein